MLSLIQFLYFVNNKKEMIIFNNPHGHIHWGKKNTMDACYVHVITSKQLFTEFF